MQSIPKKKFVPVLCVRKTFKCQEFNRKTLPVHEVRS